MNKSIESIVENFHFEKGFMTSENNENEFLDPDSLPHINLTLSEMFNKHQEDKHKVHQKNQ